VSLPPTALYPHLQDHVSASSGFTSSDPFSNFLPLSPLPLSGLAFKHILRLGTATTNGAGPAASALTKVRSLTPLKSFSGIDSSSTSKAGSLARIPPAAASTPPG